MDEEHLAALRKWGDGLRLDDRDEVRAAGKAIVLLCEEVERLEMALWNVRAAPAAPRASTPQAEIEEPDEARWPAEPEAPDAIAALRARLRRFLRAPFVR
jgi:hypothetical protein